MTSAIAIIYANTEVQNRIREAHGFGPGHAPERPARDVPRTAKRSRWLHRRVPAVGAARA